MFVINNHIAMSGLIKAFDRYSLIYTAVKPTETGQFIANIGCFSSTTLVGYIYFYPDGAALPVNTINSSGIINL
jgi:hypothetical protein